MVGLPSLCVYIVARGQASKTECTDSNVGMLPIGSMELHCEENHLKGCGLRPFWGVPIKRVAVYIRVFFGFPRYRDPIYSDVQA